MRWPVAARLLALVASCACSRDSREFGWDAGLLPPVSDRLLSIAFAADTRRTTALPAEALHDHAPPIRRAAARAIARILDDDDGAALTEALSDEDDEVVSWAAYGLGESCKGHEEVRTRALAARLAGLGDGGRADISVLRAIGRCASDLAEATLRPWLRGGSDRAEAASFALGEVASRRGALSAETVATLLDVASGSPPLAAALYPLGRPEVALGDADSRLRRVAIVQLAHPGPLRLVAVRALARVPGDDAVEALSALLRATSDASVAERAEAVRSLARAGDGGEAALAAYVTAFDRRKDATFDASVNVVALAIESLSARAAESAEPSLWRLARATAWDPGGAAVRRTSMVRCAAAAKLARGKWDSDLVEHCDLGSGEIGERTRLAAIAPDDAVLSNSRASALATLARSAHPRVREAALERVARHPEMKDAGIALLIEGLSAREAGVAAKAAEIVKAHPDPLAVPALRSALARFKSPDLVDVRACLFEAALALGMPEGRAYAEEACKDDNVTLRARAEHALSTGGASVRCPRPDAAVHAAHELGHELSVAVRIELDTDAGHLALVLDPSSAPVTVTRLVSLARDGFYVATSFHHVVPGYVVAFGDRGGDGYGGSGDSLRCETSPIAFTAGDIGLALAGRDTGSSQLFVTLSRSPALDGQYPWVGRAEGDWDSVVEGDEIRALRVVP